MVVAALASPSVGTAGAADVGGADGAAGTGSAVGRIDQTAVCLEDLDCSKRMWKEASKPSGM